MKSRETMHRLARAHAWGLGPRVWKGRRCGYYLTVGELLSVYRQEGFNHLGTAMRKHILHWMAEDKAVLEGSDEKEDSAVWFDCPAGCETVVMVRSEQCGGRYVAKIDRLDWPILRQIHGIQAELEGCE